MHTRIQTACLVSNPHLNLLCSNLRSVVKLRFYDILLSARALKPVTAGHMCMLSTCTLYLPKHFFHLHNMCTCIHFAHEHIVHLRTFSTCTICAPAHIFHLNIFFACTICAHAYILHLSKSEHIALGNILRFAPHFVQQFLLLIRQKARISFVYELVDNTCWVHVDSSFVVHTAFDKDVRQNVYFVSVVVARNLFCDVLRHIYRVHAGKAYRSYGRHVPYDRLSLQIAPQLSEIPLPFLQHLVHLKLQLCVSCFCR